MRFLKRRPKMAVEINHIGKCRRYRAMGATVFEWVFPGHQPSTSRGRVSERFRSGSGRAAFGVAMVFGRATAVVLTATVVLIASRLAMHLASLESLENSSRMTVPIAPDQQRCC
jgi:hypothetical protein